MSNEKSKPSQNPKSAKDKKPSELRDDDLREVSGGLASTGGVKPVDDGGCISLDLKRVHRSGGGESGS